MSFIASLIRNPNFRGSQGGGTRPRIEGQREGGGIFPQCNICLNSLADGTLLDPWRRNQQEKLVKNFFGGNDQSVGQNVKHLGDKKINE